MIDVNDPQVRQTATRNPNSPESFAIAREAGRQELGTNRNEDGFNNKGRKVYTPGLYTRCKRERCRRAGRDQFSGYCSVSHRDHVPEVVEVRHCQNPPCSNQLTGNQKKYCSTKCIGKSPEDRKRRGEFGRYRRRLEFGRTPKT